MKKLLLTCLMMIPVLVYAQLRIGVRGGLNLANFNGSEVVEWGAANADPTAQIKFHLGVYADYYILENISIQPGLFYSAKGPKYQGEIEIYNNMGEFMMEDITYKKRLGYLDIPIVVHYHINENLSVFAGPQFSFLIRAKIKNDASREVLDALGLEEDQDAKDFYRGFDIALPVGVAYELTSGINIQLNYDIGLINIAKGYDYDGGEGGDKYFNVKNGVVQLSIGYVIRDDRERN